MSSNIYYSINNLTDSLDNCESKQLYDAILFRFKFLCYKQYNKYPCNIEDVVELLKGTDIEYDWMLDHLYYIEKYNLYNKPDIAVFWMLNKIAYKLLER